LLFPTVVTIFLLGVKPTIGFSLFFDLEHGTLLPLPLSLPWPLLRLLELSATLACASGIVIKPVGRAE
jgi:hypothetical protein